MKMPLGAKILKGAKKQKRNKKSLAMENTIEMTATGGQAWGLWHFAPLFVC